MGRAGRGEGRDGDGGGAEANRPRPNYTDALEQRLGRRGRIMRQIIHRVAREPKRIVFAKAEDPRVLRALEVMVEDGIAKPLVLGNEKALREQAEGLDVKLDGVEFVALATRPSLEAETQALLARRGRRGMTGPNARALLATDATVAGLMMVREGADGARGGAGPRLPGDDPARAAARGPGDGRRAAAGVHVVVTKRGPVFFADTTVNIAPDAATLADIALMTARFAREVGVEPHVAMLSFANFGSSRHPEAVTVSDAVAIVRGRDASSTSTARCRRRSRSTLPRARGRGRSRRCAGRRTCSSSRTSRPATPPTSCSAASAGPTKYAPSSWGCGSR